MYEIIFSPQVPKPEMRGVKWCQNSTNSIVIAGKCLHIQKLCRSTWKVMHLNQSRIKQFSQQLMSLQRKLGCQRQIGTFTRIIGQYVEMHHSGKVLTAHIALLVRYLATAGFLDVAQPKEHRTMESR